MILGASKTYINQWEVVVNGEGHMTRAGYVVLNVTEEYLWVCSNEPLMGFEIAYIHGGARVNV